LQQLRLGSGLGHRLRARRRFDQSGAVGVCASREIEARPLLRPAGGIVRIERVEDASGGAWADLVEELQDPEPGGLVGGVAHQSDQGEEVLDVGGFEVADTAVLDEGDAAAAELELEQIGVVAGAHQDGLVAQACPLLVVGEHAVGDLVRLLGFVPAE
jgi:hypothetical protein